MKALTVVGFASGSPLSQLAMARIARAHRLTAVVVPERQAGLGARVRRWMGRTPDPFADLDVPLIAPRGAAQLRPDLLVAASFPGILGVLTLCAARLGALNVHMSLLPRHRGIDPVFWTYWDDDRDAGVTVHWMDERVDAGEIAAQSSFPLERGLPSQETYMKLAAQGVELLDQVLAQVASGLRPAHPQDERLATHESSADIARARVPVAQWPAERVWHVLGGLGDQRSGLIADEAGRPLEHGRATSYHLTGDVRPGRIVAVADGYEVHCRDGVVRVDGRGPRHDYNGHQWREA